MKYLLSTNSITKKYGKHTVVDKVNIHVKQGSIYGLIGRNGAGKTTIMKMISGLASVTDGEYTLFGQSGNNIQDVTSRMGILIESPGFYAGKTAYENMLLKCICLGIKKDGYIEDLLKLVGLENTSKKKVGKFSLGMKQRLGIALALVGDPDLLVLDEPINGLDPQGIIEVREMILKLNRERGITIIISSHILEELSKIATDYAIINNGKLIEELTQEQLIEKCEDKIELKTSDSEKACVVIESLGIENYKVISNEIINIYDTSIPVKDLTIKFVEENIAVDGITRTHTPLEDYFVNITGGTENA